MARHRTPFGWCAMVRMQRGVIHTAVPWPCRGPAFARCRAGRRTIRLGRCPSIPPGRPQAPPDRRRPLPRPPRAPSPAPRTRPRTRSPPPRHPPRPRGPRRGVPRPFLEAALRTVADKQGRRAQLRGGGTGTSGRRPCPDDCACTIVPAPTVRAPAASCAHRSVHRPLPTPTVPHPTASPTDRSSHRPLRAPAVPAPPAPARGGTWIPAGPGTRPRRRRGRARHRP